MKQCYALLFGFLFLCGTAFGQAKPRLIINEFLADPPTPAETGDANRDGKRSSSEDEFVELANVTRDTLDLTGWKLGDDEAVNFTFPKGYKLPPRGIVVVFGGGDPSKVPGYDPNPLKSRVLDADSTVGNGLANGGEIIVLLSPDGKEDMWLAYGSLANAGPPTTPAVSGVTFEFGVAVEMRADEDVSLTRSPDGNTKDANPWKKHSDISTALFSPGSTVDGQGTVPKQLPKLTVVINEVLADPATSAELGDANGDGTRSSSGDEFVELANVSDVAVNLSGYTLGDDENHTTFTFPQGYTLGPREFVVIFGGGDVTKVPGYDADRLKTRAFVVDSLHLGIGNGLANGGDIIMLISPDGSYDTYLAYGSLADGSGPKAGTYPAGTDFEIEINVAAPANADNSITRFPDGNVNVIDPFVQHVSVSNKPFSPGRTIDGKSKVPAPKPPVTVVINEVLADAAAGDANRDGAVDAKDQFIEIANTSKTTPVDLSGWRVGDAGGLTFTFPQGYKLAPQAFVAVFGGGNVTKVPGYDADPLKTRVFAASGTLGNGLDKAGDYAVLLSADGKYDSYVAYGNKQGAGEPSVTGTTAVEWEFDLATAVAADQASSITRNPDGDILAADPFALHKSLGTLAFSPAQTSKGLNALDDFVRVPHPWGSGHVLKFSWFERDRLLIPQAASVMPLRMDRGTIEMWFKPDSVITNNTHDPDWTYLFSKNLSGNHPGDLGLGWERGDGRLVFFMQDGQSTTNLYSSERIDDVFHPRWYHVAITWNTQDSMRIFIDGKKVAAAKSEIPLLGGAQEIAIGNGAVNLFNSRYEGFRGMIDEVRFSLDERYKQNFTVPKEPFKPDNLTLALWHLDEGNGEIAKDAMGHGFDARLGGEDATGKFDPRTKPTWVNAATFVANETSDLPARFELGQNYPNPFNPVTTIQYSVPRAADVELSVYNVLGQQVQMLVRQQLNAGTYTTRFDGSGLASGIYFYVLRSADVHLVQKMVLLK